MTTTATSHHPYGETYGGSAPENYERFFVPAIGGPLATDLIAEAGLRPGERVLDVACRTGLVTRLAAERVGPRGTVAALDVNAGMLAVARRCPRPMALVVTGWRPWIHHGGMSYEQGVIVTTSRK